MTREELIEVMARAILNHEDDIDWHAVEPEPTSLSLATAALAAIEAAGVRLIYTNKAQVQLIDSGERTSYTIISW